MRFLLFFVLVIVFMATGNVRGDYFFLPPNATAVGPVTQQKADQIALHLFSLYHAEVFKTTRMPLQLETRWEDPYYGASALKGTPPGVIAIFARGGMIRTPEMSEDILALVFCHELGHALGGTPYQSTPGSEWSSIEGQADFFAASRCLPTYFNSRSSTPIPTIELQKKILDTSLAAVRFFQKYSFLNEESVALEKQAPEVATQLNLNSYPSLQCRLDTFKAGAFCAMEPTQCKAPACWWPR